MTLQMVHFHQRNVQRQCHAFGKRGAYQQAAQQTRTARESNGTHFFSAYAGTLEGGIHYRENVLHVSARCQLGNDTAILFMHFLTCNDVAQQQTVTQHGT